MTHFSNRCQKDKTYSSNIFYFINEYKTIDLTDFTYTK